ncbi:Ubiquitin-conjugating enzyme E2 15 [Fusarium oxysporum f. sp. albedinis]|nr:Ubiquitin-conjugating enzyme E2 15 [Fusarium oxysporum f. sp. albedinis]
MRNGRITRAVNVITGKQRAYFAPGRQIQFCVSVLVLYHQKSLRHIKEAGKQQAGAGPVSEWLPSRMAPGAGPRISTRSWPVHVPSQASELVIATLLYR